MPWVTSQRQQNQKQLLNPKGAVLSLIKYLKPVFCQIILAEKSRRQGVCTAKKMFHILCEILLEVLFVHDMIFFS